jgi:hypothetical protein
MVQFLFALLVLMPLYGVADNVYRTTDANGNAVFTDTPPSDGRDSEQVDIPHINTTPAPQRVFMPVSNTGSEEEQRKPPAYAVAISTPLNDTTIPLGPGNFSVSVAVSAELGVNDSLQLFIDNKPQGEPQRTTTWALTNVFPGQHNLTVAVVDDSGERLATSAAVRVFVLRTSSIRRHRNNN